MSDKLLIVPYFGKLPNYFQIWLNRIQLNNNLDFLLFTDQNLDNYNVQFRNLKIIKMSLAELKKNIEFVTGTRIKLHKAYKVNDYRPLFGEIFSKYTQGYLWIGTIDTDVILGNTSHFLTDELIQNYDRINGNGHFSIWKNNNKLNELWKSKGQNKYKDVIPFDLVRLLNVNAAFDEYGWKFGKGISTFMIREGYTIQDTLSRADLDFNFSGFRSEHINQSMKNFAKIEVNKEGMFAINESDVQEIMYVHLQKRSMDVSRFVGSSENKFNIIPNKFISDDECITENEKEKMLRKFNIERKHRIFKTRRKNLFSDYIVLRMIMWFRSKHHGKMKNI